VAVNQNAVVVEQQSARLVSQLELAPLRAQCHEEIDADQGKQDECLRRN
jgi:hypothetical protein